MTGVLWQQQPQAEMPTAHSAPVWVGPGGHGFALGQHLVLSTGHQLHSK